MKITPSTGAIAGTYAAGDGPGGLAFDGTNLWIANRHSNNVTKMSTKGAVLGTFAVGKRPIGLAFAGGNIWVANNFSNSVTRLSTAGAVLGTYEVGKGPFGVAAEGLNVWITNYFAQSVTKLRASDGFNLGTFKVGDGAAGIAFRRNEFVGREQRRQYFDESYDGRNCRDYVFNRQGSVLGSLGRSKSLGAELRKQFRFDDGSQLSFTPVTQVKLNEVSFNLETIRGGTRATPDSYLRLTTTAPRLNSHLAHCCYGPAPFRLCHLYWRHSRSSSAVNDY